MIPFLSIPFFSYVALIFIMFALATTYYIYKIKIQHFKTFFSFYSAPACIINTKDEVTWFNKEFEKAFPKIKKKDKFSKFQIEIYLNNKIIKFENNTYLLNYLKLNSSFFGIIFQPSNIIEMDIWNNIPMPIVILNKNNAIEYINCHFEDLIGSQLYNENISKFSTNILQYLNFKNQEQSKEIIWKTLENLIPIQTFFYKYGEKNILFLENKMEYIKLKNKAHESQHLQILGQLSSIMIHDFNNLLTAIYALTEELEKKYSSNDLLSQIKQKMTQASQLSNEILSFLKGQTQDKEKNYTQPKLFIPNLQILFNTILTSKIKCKLNLTHDGVVGISESQMQQIILNMILNSKDAISESGTISITSNIRTFSAPYQTYTILLQPMSYYVIEIKDTGSGISAENIAKIFSPFFTTKTKGTGLGLASCMRIAENAGGGIDFSTSQNGTIFQIMLPLIVLKNEEKESKLIGQNQPKNKPYQFSLLLVEDQEEIRKIMSKSLENEGYSIDNFGTAQQAIEALNKKQYNCLITDAILPDKDGSIIAHFAKTKYPNIKILVISGYPLSEIQQFFPQNINYIAKPFKLLDLKQELNKILQ